MARTNTVEVPTPKDFNTFDDLLAELATEGRSHIHVVKVDDQGMVEPERRGKAFVMQPKVRVVVTALDYKKPEILRFERKRNAGSGAVSIDVFSGRGSYVDPSGVKTRDQVIAALEARGLQVSKGEWTPGTAAALQGVKVKVREPLDELGVDLPPRGGVIEVDDAVGGEHDGETGF